MDRDASWSNNSLLNSNELFILKGPLAMGFKMGTKNFAKLYVAVPMADSIGLILGNPLANGLCTLLSPYRMPDLLPTGFNFSNSDVEIFFLVSKSLRIILNFFSKLSMYLISLPSLMLAF